MDSSSSNKSLPPWVVAGLGYALLLAYRAWPLVGQPASALVDPLALGNPGGMWAKSDLDLLVWIVGWTAHAIVTQPLELFQGNIFYPSPDALASSEHLIGLLPISAPVFWASGNAVLAYNVTTLMVVWLAAFSTFLLIFTWTGRASAAFLAGALFALGDHLPLSFLRLHVSAIHLYPLVLLLAWRAARRPSPAALVALWVVAALQALAGIYVAFGLGVLVVAASPALIALGRQHGNRGLAPLLTLALAAIPLALVAAPYLRMQAAGLLPDESLALTLVRETSHGASALFGRLHGELTTLGLLLAFLGLLRSRANPLPCLCLATIAIAGFVLSLGTNATLANPAIPSPYELLMELVPGFSGMRSPGRFLALTEFALAGLAGLGAAGIVEFAAKRGRDSARRLAASAIVLFAALSVPLRAPHWPLPLSQDPLGGTFVGSHRWLARHATPGPVLDLPALNSAMEGRALLSTGRAMLGSTLHWFPLLNGYSGHPPASQALIMTLAQRLPDPTALEDLCALTGIRWIVVHHGLLDESEAAWQGAPHQTPIVLRAELGRDAIYEVDCPTTGDRSGVADEPAPALPANARRAALSLTLPRFATGQPTRIWAYIENLGDQTWPGLRPPGRGGVVLRTRWYEPETGALVQADPAIPLANDLAPGAILRAQFQAVPPQPGEYLLDFEIAQEGSGPFQLQGKPVQSRVRVQ